MLNSRSVPPCSWLAAPGKVLLKRHVRRSKYEPLVDEVDVLDVNPRYAHVRLPSGQATTVSVRDLAPPGDIPVRGRDEDAVLQPGIACEPSQDPELIPADCDDQSQPRELIVDPPDASLGTNEAGDTSALRPNVDVESRVRPNVDVETRVPPRRSMRERRAPKRLDL